MVTFSTSSTFSTSLPDLEYRRRSIPFEERAVGILRSREVRSEKAERGGSRCVDDSSLIQGAARGLRPVGDLRRRPAEAPRRSGGAMRARPPRKACPRRDGLSRCARRRPTCRPAGLAQCPLPATSPTLSTFPTSSDEQYLGKAVFTLRPAVAPLMGQAVVSDCRLLSLRPLRSLRPRLGPKRRIAEPDSPPAPSDPLPAIGEGRRRFPRVRVVARLARRMARCRAARYRMSRSRLTRRGDLPCDVHRKSAAVLPCRRADL